MSKCSSGDQSQSVVDYAVEIDVPDIERWRRGNTGISFVHAFSANKPGPHLLLTALVHGNEPAGAVALDRLLSQEFRPTRGRLTLVFANVDAYARFNPAAPRASRWVDEDMNRVWTAGILDVLPCRSAEAMRAAELRSIVDSADYMLDLHTTQHQNEPLVLAGPLDRSRRLARALGLADLVVSDLGHAQGARMRDYGHFGEPNSFKTALLIECGQHWAASSAEIAYAACLRILDRLGMLSSAFELGRTAALPDQASRFVEVTLPVTVKHGFIFSQPLRGGEIIPKAGTVIGHDGGEPVVTPYDDCVVIMPSQRLWAGLTAVRLGRLTQAPKPTRLPLERFSNT